MFNHGLILLIVLSSYVDCVVISIVADYKTPLYPDFTCVSIIMWIGLDNARDF